MPPCLRALMGLLHLGPAQRTEGPPDRYKNRLLFVTIESVWTIGFMQLAQKSSSGWRSSSKPGDP
jgi:hypothetical protein